MNVLFTSAGRRVELLRAFRRALDDLGMEGRLIAVDIDPLAAALQVADASHLVPRFSDPGYVPALLDICRSEEARILVPLIDTEMPVLVDHIDTFERAGTRPLVLGPEHYRLTADKLETYRFFRDLGVPTPQTWTPGELDPKAVGYPLFVKPRRGSSGKDAFEARDRRELEFFCDYVVDPIVQERLPGPEITSDVLCDASGAVRAVVSRRRIEVRAGEVSKGITVHDPEIIEGCVEIAEGLKATCPITIQCMLKDGRPLFTEVNARLGGGVPLALAAGARLVEWLLALEAEIDVTIPPVGSYRTGVSFTRFDDAFTLSEEVAHAAQSRRLRS